MANFLGNMNRKKRENGVKREKGGENGLKGEKMGNNLTYFQIFSDNVTYFLKTPIGEAIDKWKQTNWRSVKQIKRPKDTNIYNILFI